MCMQTIIEFTRTNPARENDVSFHVVLMEEAIGLTSFVGSRKVVDDSDDDDDFETVKKAPPAQPKKKP